MNCLTDQYFLEELLKRLKLIPLFSSYSTDYLKRNIEVTLLPSLSNNTYKVSINNHSYLLKIPRADTKQFIDRYHEQTNTQIAFNLGLAPKVLWQSESGIYLIHYLENIRHLNSKDLHNPHFISKLVTHLSTLQKSSAPFKGDLHNTETIRNHLNQYYKLCTDNVQNKLKKTHVKALLMLDKIEQYDSPAVPSHSDLTLGNILVEKNKEERVWLIDWEYSAMASPFWDIATLCNEGTFNDMQANDFLSKFINTPTKKEIELLAHYRFLLKGLSQCWQGAFQINKPCSMSGLIN